MMSKTMSFRDVLLMGLDDLKTEMESSPEKAKIRITGMIQFLSLMTKEIDRDTIKLKRVV